VDAETVNKLLEINRSFYSRFSGEFSDSRPSERFNLEPFRAVLSNNIRLLDAGCGNGRLADRLAQAGLALNDVGIDGSPALIAIAKERAVDLVSPSHFRVVDLAVPDWSRALADVAPFDVIVALAVLHHIPSFALRVQVVREMRSLAQPDGTLVLSNWQILTDERLRNKVVDWETAGVPRANVEPMDYLMDWKRGGTGYRYVHMFDEAEISHLAEAGGWRVVEQRYTDNDLNLFSILKTVG
jgi:2-polyprenyl-3-methyl-5-hydroxy-6-metoxy-1,4-benzoquinol methylase